MSTVKIEIPEEFVRSFGATDEEAARNAKIELAIQMCREGKWTMGRAAQFSGIYVGKFMDLLRERGVGQIYTAEMLAQDVAYGLGRA